MIILIHSSKTMKPYSGSVPAVTSPLLIEQATELAEYLRSLPVSQLKESMKISDKLAAEVTRHIDDWGKYDTLTSAAAFCFKGDIYSGLQVQNFSNEDLLYANDHLRIISGLYGILRPLDAIYPYRLEMAYKFPDEPYTNLYSYWSNQIANTLPKYVDIINLTSLEYTKAVSPFVDSNHVYSPVFLSYNATTRLYGTVAVHSKIARGAFARWLIVNRINSVTTINKFKELGYTYNIEMSSKYKPVFTCDEFGGKGLSTRLI